MRIPLPPLLPDEVFEVEGVLRDFARVLSLTASTMITNIAHEVPIATTDKPSFRGFMQVFLTNDRGLCDSAWTNKFDGNIYRGLEVFMNAEKSKFIKVGGLVLAVLVVAGLGIGIILYKFKGDKDGKGDGKGDGKSDGKSVKSRETTVQERILEDANKENKKNEQDDKSKLLEKPEKDGKITEKPAITEVKNQNEHQKEKDAEDLQTYVSVKPKTKEDKPKDEVEVKPMNLADQKKGLDGKNELKQVLEEKKNSNEVDENKSKESVKENKSDDSAEKNFADSNKSDDLAGKNLTDINRPNDSAERNLIDTKKSDDSAEKNLTDTNKSENLAVKNLADTNKSENLAEKNLTDTKKSDEIVGKNLASMNRPQDLAEENSANTNKSNGSTEKNVAGGKMPGDKLKNVVEKNKSSVVKKSKRKVNQNPKKPAEVKKEEKPSIPAKTIVVEPKTDEVISINAKKNKSPAKMGLECDLEFEDDLENMNCPLAEDVDNKLLNRLLESNARNLQEPKGAVKDRYRSRIFVFNGDIITLGVDAITNAANEGCLYGGGIDGAINNACRDKKGTVITPICNSGLGVSALCERVARYLKNDNPRKVRCPTGTARVVSVVGFPREKMKPGDDDSKRKLLHENIRYIFQAVGPTNEDIPMLRSTYLSVLNNAKKLKIRHVALNCISTGIYGFDINKAADTAVKTVREWMEANDDSALNVVFVLFGGPNSRVGDYNKQIGPYRTAIAKYFPLDS